MRYRHLKAAYGDFAAKGVLFVLVAWLMSLPAAVVAEEGKNGVIYHMKLIGPDISDADLERIRDLGFSVLNGEWGMERLSAPQLLKFLDRLDQRNLKFIVNFSEYSAWGFSSGGNHPPDQRPQWQSQRVKNYLKKIAFHPAIYAYDISNEAGVNLPNGRKYRISLAQMREAARDVRRLDPKRPILIRMHYWDDEDGDFTEKNPFADGIADIVMLNLYSNYSLDGKRALLPGMVKDSAAILVRKIHAIDRDVHVWISLAAFRDLPSFIRPKVSDIHRDVRFALAVEGVESIGFFGWGERSASWYLPRDGSDLVQAMERLLCGGNSPSGRCN